MPHNKNTPYKSKSGIENVTYVKDLSTSSYTAW